GRQDIWANLVGGRESCPALVGQIKLRSVGAGHYFLRHSRGKVGGTEPRNNGQETTAKKQRKRMGKSGDAATDDWAPSIRVLQVSRSTRADRAGPRAAGGE